MTDTPAERVARECAEDAAFHEVTPMAPGPYKQVVERNVGYFLPIIAAAINEAVLAEAKWWNERIHHMGNWNEARMQLLEQRARGESQP